MSYHLSSVSIRLAIKHICKYGDTDVFPHLPEQVFYKEEIDAITSELSALDIASYKPQGAFEALSPKSRFGFRITHQQSLLDTVLFLASVIEIGEKIEARRLPHTELGAFSYRFSPNNDGSLFIRGHTFKDWLIKQQALIKNNLKIKKVIITDISDFYARINFHRLENLLDEAAPRNGAATYIKKLIKVIRAKQSFGLPVGGTAARILAELTLSDTDSALKDESFISTRFVDDFRFFLKEEDPYDVLSLLANQLAVNEGLALNAAKTKVLNSIDYLKLLEDMLGDIADEAHGKALETLTTDIYLDDDPDVEDVEKLKALNLLEFLQNEISKNNYDSGRIKVIFRALKIAKPKEAIQYISVNFSELLVFAKELSLLMQALTEEYGNCFENLTDNVISAILEPPASSIQIIRTWLLELFVRGSVPINKTQIKKLSSLPSVLDKRQMYIIRGRIRDNNFFRSRKTSFDQIPPFEKPAFIYGSSCFSKDELDNWLATIKPTFDQPTSNLFIKWIKLNKDNLIGKLGAPSEETEDHLDHKS